MPRRSRKDLTPLEIMRSPIVPTEKQVEHMGDRLMVCMGWRSIHFLTGGASKQAS